jgi:hypothetical protein
MVTADQGGHGVYPFGPNTCANDAVTAFLIVGPCSGSSPATGES